LIRTILTVPNTQLVNILATIAAVNGTGKGVRITETNSVTSGGLDGISNTYASALWALDHTFTLAQGGASGVNFHGGDNPSYTPFSFTSSSLQQIRPLYYGILFFTMMGSGPVLSSSIDAGGSNISIYAIRTASGYSVLFVNKEETTSFEVTLNLPDPVSSATSIYLKGGGLTSKTGINIQKGEVSLASGQLAGMEDSYIVGISAGAPIVKVPPLAAVLVKAS
jgi:hypothetical protein